jgi:signal transduction histidine kinase
VTRGSLRLRLLLAGALSVLVAVTLSGFGLTLLFERHVERRVEAELGVYLNRIIAGLDRGTDGEVIMSKPPSDPRFATPLSGLYWQVQVGGTILRSRSLWDSVLELPPDETTAGAVVEHRIAGPAGAQLIALERKLMLPPRLGGTVMRAVVAIDSSDVVAATHAFTVDLLPYLFVIAVFLIAAAYAQVAVGLRPLAAVRARLFAIREGKARRLGEGFPDEIVPLAAEVDALFGAHEMQIEKARARAGDLAHGLKTPLQLLAGDVEVLRTRGEAQIADDIEHVATSMRRHVDREIARARMAAGSREARADIADVVERVVSVVVRTPAGGKLEWSIDIPPGQVGRIDPDDLAEAIGNLVENAARYAHRKVLIQSRSAPGLVVITVADDGPGIPPEHLADVLARGGQLDRSGSGAGLGLAIVGDIAEAWHGRFELRTTAAGLQADFCVPAIERARGDDDAFDAPAAITSAD